MKISDDTLMLLDDHIVITQQISFNPFTASFDKRIAEWDAKLKLIQEVIMNWIEVQK